MAATPPVLLPFVKADIDARAKAIGVTATQLSSFTAANRMDLLAAMLKERELDLTAQVLAALK